MPRTARVNLSNKTVRARLKARANPYFETIAPCRLLGYIKQSAGAGQWMVQVEIGRTDAGVPLRRRARLALADDLAPADGIGVLDHIKARAMAASWDPETRRSDALTVRQACEHYIAAKRAADGEEAAHDAERRIRLHVLAEDTDGKPIPGKISLANRPIAALTLSELRGWRDGLVVNSRARGTANRIMANFKAALNHAFADEANGITTDAAWRRLESFTGADNARTDHFSVEEVQHLIDVITDEPLKNLVAAGWLTGARLGELVHCDVRHYDRRHGMLMIPRGKTGGRAVTLTVDAQAFFTDITKGRRGTEPLLPNADGQRWSQNEQYRPMKALLDAAGLPASASFYTLRHSHISRAIECDVPLTIIAENVGTSVRMIEKHYAKVLAAKRRELLERAASATRLVLVRKPEARGTAA